MGHLEGSRILVITSIALGNTGNTRPPQSANSVLTKTLHRLWYFLPEGMCSALKIFDALPEKVKHERLSGDLKTGSVSS